MSADETIRSVGQALGGKTFDDLEALDAVEPEATNLVAALMIRSARDSQKIQDDVIEWEQRDHARTKEKLRQANERIALMQYRMDWLLGLHDDPFGHPFDLGA